ncbi:hypothetical protein [Dysgonomonas macrotermitis]|uniref:DUF8202 domain-containing protein n=1 Tax=Dysgonomonas macrotermitis TaxID=1346286 RepID=A0A1M4ZKS5_9BACT|nr:hypothetical protein [Dysgonomonas macrotermitis]SHF18601.1 hypothetical protein SAMN05444362_104118 [Dysgonomonas macrotermitis]
MKIYNYLILSLWIILASSFVNGMYAQTPGGTALTIELWLQADKVQNTIPADGSNITQWLDKSSNNIHFKQNAALLVPRIKYSAMNYNPSIEFYTDVEEGNASTAERNRSMIAETAMTVTSNKAYYTFWVSVMDDTQSSSLATVINYGGSTSDNDGWRNATSNKNIWMQNYRGSSFYHSTGIGKLYGIGTSIRPNDYVTANPIRLYHNGQLGTATTGRAQLSPGNTFPIIGKSSSTATTNYFFGEILEVIVVSADAGTYISDLDLEKIHSYLAIKYGITLENQNIISSDGTVVWDGTGTLNDGYKNNVFGIGKDSGSGLDQKQSNSFDKKVATVFVDELKDLNSNNAGTIADGNFLMFGSNTGSEVSAYTQAKGTAYLNGSIVEELNAVQNIVLKAQTTGQSSYTVNIKPHVGSKYVLVSPDDPTFAPNKTRIYLVENEVAKDVLINDGDLVGFATFITAPGGVFQNLRVWLKADDPASIVLAGDNNVSVWKDQTYNGNDYSYADVAYTGKTYPQYVECDEKMNFHAAVDFSITSYLARKEGPMKEDAPTDFTSFVSYYATAYASNDRLYTHGFGSNNPRAITTRTPAMGFAPGDGVGRVRNSNGAPGQTDVDGTLVGFEKFTTALQMINTHSAGTVNNSGYAIHDFGGWQEKVSATGLFGTGFKMASGGTLGGASITSGSFQGLISEVFFYEQALTEPEQDKIRTYLGIKYAITLDADDNNPDLNYNYILSDGSTIVWKGNSSPNKGFHNNIAGLVRDDNSIFINKAKSTSKEGIIGMMVEGHDICGQGDAVSESFTNNLSGLFWGDNQINNTITYTEEDCYAFSTRTSRVWLVQKTNLNQMTVTILAGAAGGSSLDNYMNNGYQAYLLVADNESDFDNDAWKLVIPGTFKDGYHRFDYTFTNEYTYFALAFEALPGNCESCTFKGDDGFNLTRSNLGASSVTITSPSSPVIKTGLATDNGNLTMDVEFKIASGVNRMRIRPGGNRGAVNLNSSGSANALSTITYTLSMPANVSFAIGDIDLYETAEVYGYCNGVRVYPANVYREPLAGANKRRGYTFDIVGNSKAVGNGKQSPGRGNPRAMLHFDFGFAVEQIVIEYSSSRASTRYLDLFAMQFSCPQPLPPPNEAGYSMQKKGTLETHVCGIVDYTFTILNANNECDSARVYFEDILPIEMEWLANSLAIDANLVDTTIEESGGNSIILEDNRMIIDKLKLPGNGKTITFRAQAIFKEDAPINQTYYNQSKITYVRKDNQESESLLSTDAYFIEGVDTDKRTPTFVIDDARDYKYLSAQMELKPSDCFRENNEIEVTLKIDNPNASIPDMFLEIGYNENFHYKAGSFKINGTVAANATEYVEIEDDGSNTPIPGYTIVKGFTLPGNATGSPTTITYTIVAPGLSDLEFETVDGNPIYYPMGIGFDLNTEAEDGICLQNAFLNTIGDNELPYCSSKKYIITNKNVTNRIKK